MKIYIVCTKIQNQVFVLRKLYNIIGIYIDEVNLYSPEIETLDSGTITDLTLP